MGIFVKKAVRDGIGVAGAVGAKALAKAAPRGIAKLGIDQVGKHTLKVIVKGPVLKTIGKVAGPAIYAGMKAYDGVKYLHDNNDRIKKNGLGETIKQDFNEGMAEHPVATVAKIIL